MTVPVINSQPSITFTVVENGVYNLPFDALDNADNLQAWYRDGNDVAQDLQFGTDLIINFDSGYGTIFLVKDLAVGNKFTVVRKVQNDQSKTFKSTQLFSSQIEDSLDKLTILAQDNSFEGTCLRATADETIADDTKLELPAGQNRIYTALKIDETGGVSTAPLKTMGVKIPATKSDLGFVIPGEKLSLEESGLIDVPPADNDTLGVVKIGEEISIDDGAISFSVPENVLQDISDAETNITNTNTLLQGVTTNIPPVESIASIAKTKVNEQVVYSFLTPPGETWTAATTPPSGSCYALAVENGRWVAVGSSSKAAYSADGGVTWTSATTPPSGTYNGLAVENGRWVAVGLSSKAAYSADGGETWTSATTPPPSGLYYALAVENGRWVAVGVSSKAAYSADGGETWTSATTPPSGDYYTLAVENGRWVVVGLSSRAAYSADGGVTWTSATTPPSGDYYALAVENGRWVAVGWSSAAYSVDGGVTWTSATTPPSGDYYALAVENGRWVAVGMSSKAAYSADGGETWTSATTPPPSGNYRALAVENWRCVAVGLSSKAAYSEGQSEYLTVPDAINRVLEQKGV